MAETPLHALIGPAGTGKTYKIQQKLLKSPKWGKLCATTGIAAINLGAGITGEGVITLQSTLGYFDTNSLRENFSHGKLRRVLQAIAGEHRFLIIDEMSMLDAETLDMLVETLDGINGNISEDHGEHALGLILVGDFLQLPPVEGEYCFEATSWKRFSIEKLTEIKRQVDPVFQEILQAARCGDGDTAAKMLKTAGCFKASPSMAGDITTIFAVNAKVDEWNDSSFRRLCATGAAKGAIKSSRWGKQRKEWKNIPEVLTMAIGAYVMILSNDTKEWNYANGDCGTITAFSIGALGDDTNVGGILVKLKRTGKVVEIRRIIRKTFQKETPLGEEIPSFASLKEWKEEQKGEGKEFDDWKQEYLTHLASLTYKARAARLKPSDPYFDFIEEKWVMGEILYCPLRLAYASTVHKCLVPSTQLLTEQGFVRLRDIQIGDRIWNGEQYATVLGKANTQQMAYRITTHHGFSIVCGEDHPFPVVNGKNILVPGSELEPDMDELSIPAAPVWDVENDRDKISSDLGWLLGALVGDASYNSEKDGSVFFCSHNNYLNGKVLEIAANVLTCNPRKRKDNKGVYWSSVPVRRMLLDLGLTHTTARDKEIPKCIFTSSTAVMRSFVQGLFDTDGSVGRSFVVYATSSKKVATGLQMLLWRLGIYANKTQYETVDYGSYHQLRINGHSLAQFKKLIGFSRPDRKEKLDRLNPNRIITKWEGKDRVTNVECLNKIMPMIDIEVEGGHMFVANGILTHNSQGLTLDNVQIVPDHKFFGGPNMMYVALSRCRTLEGLKIVGSPGDVARYTNTTVKLKPWF